ncbi:MAG: hypothetical protein ACU826_05780 [Gammaproteobacteria bacterium]
MKTILSKMLLLLPFLLAVALGGEAALAGYVPYKGKTVDKASGSEVEVNAAPEEAAKSSVHSPNETVMHIERAKAEIMFDDFVPPSEHLKAARAESEKVTGNPDIVKKGTEIIIQAQIKLKDGDKSGAIDEMDKALELYQSLKAE